jgi:hypothetical protein
LPKIEHPEHDALQEVTDWLSMKKNGSWLLILDNCDDNEVLKTQVVGIPGTTSHEASYTRPLASYIPHSEHGLILATSRSKEVAFNLTADEDCHILVTPMTHREAEELLRTSLPKDSTPEDDVSQLAEQLGYIPLAIKQAAAYMQNTRMTMSKYLDYFQKNEEIQAKFLLSDIPDTNRDPDLKNSIISTWQISFDQILKQKKAAANLLSLMSSFDRQSIPRMLLDGERIATDPLASLEFEESVAVLENYNLITKLDNDSLTMHRLVQFSTQTWLRRQKMELYWRNKSLSILSQQFPTVEFEHWSTCEILYPHAQLMFGYSLQSFSRSFQNP